MKISGLSGWQRYITDKTGKITGHITDAHEQYRNGNTGFSLTTAIKISRYLGCSIDELVYGKKKQKKAVKKMIS